MKAEPSNKAAHSYERGCKDKIRIGHKTNYQKTADKMAKKHGKRYGVYQCHYCRNKHLTTNVTGERSARLLYITEEFLS